MKIFGIVGWSGSGKTTLMRQLLPELIGRGSRISTMKHTHHNFDTGGFRTADALKAAGQTVSLTHCRQAVHVDPRVFCQTLPAALEWAFAPAAAGSE